MSILLIQPSSLARRAFFAAFVGLAILIGGLVALAVWGYTILDALLAPLLGAQVWNGVQNVALGLAEDLAPYAVGLLFATLLLLWLLSRWAARPLRKLVAAAAELGPGGDGSKLPLRAPGEVGALARSFEDLSRSLEHSSSELQEQNRSLVDTVRQLEGLLRIGRELYAALDADQLIRRFATTLRETFGYECVGGAGARGRAGAYSRPAGPGAAIRSQRAAADRQRQPGDCGNTRFHRQPGPRPDACPAGGGAACRSDRRTVPADHSRRRAARLALPPDRRRRANPELARRAADGPGARIWRADAGERAPQPLQPGGAAGDRRVGQPGRDRYGKRAALRRGAGAHAPARSRHTRHARGQHARRQP